MNELERERQEDLDGDGDIGLPGFINPPRITSTQAEWILNILRVGEPTGPPALPVRSPGATRLNVPPPSSTSFASPLLLQNASNALLKVSQTGAIYCTCHDSHVC